MRMRARWASAILCLLLLTGCRGSALPAGMEEETLLSAGREVLALLVDGQFEAVHDRLRADQREAVPAEDIRELVDSALDGAGAYREIEDAMTTGQSSDGESYGVAVFYCAFADGEALIRLAFDPDMELIGISVQRQ